MRVWRFGVWVGGTAACAVFVYGPVIAKAVVLIAGTLFGLYAFMRGFLSR
jgi:hypothetical protein